ncbi:putative epoxide hydrolase [Fusarium oxysporum f. sp. albedinis]|nr:putative epoxide hydrolase [Fusarium oxysporum f. sp. albedinis]
MLIPIRYKDKTSSKTISIYISPLSITSLKHSTRINLPDAVKPILPTITYLELQLAESIAILVPSFIKELVAATRPRLGKILDSLYELLHVINLRIYILDTALFLNQLSSTSTVLA